MARIDDPIGKIKEHSQGSSNPAVASFLCVAVGFDRWAERRIDHGVVRGGVSNGTSGCMARNVGSLIPVAVFTLGLASRCSRHQTSHKGLAGQADRARLEYLPLTRYNFSVKS
jgi:hypothetical protein